MEDTPHFGSKEPDLREISGEKLVLSDQPQSVNAAPQNAAPQRASSQSASPSGVEQPNVGDSETFEPTLSPETPGDASPNLTADTVIDSRYRVISKVGEGGMAIVYKVERLYFGDFCAMKVGKHPVEQKSGRRFHQEAKTSIHLDHPNLLKVYDFGLISEQFPYFIMEFVDGSTLSDKIAYGGALSVKDTVTIFAQLCNGLVYAHDKKIVHRDIKPSNIVISGSGDSLKVKILDFGIAKLLEDDNHQKLTSTGEIFGSPLYMSPEQCGGRQVDHRSDMYSVGCTMFETLTGIPPFQGDSVFATIMMHQSNEPGSLKDATLGRDFSDDIEYVVRRLLAKSPDERYQSAMELKEDLVAISDGRSIAHKSDAGQKNSTSKKVVIAAISAVVVVPVLLLAFLALRSITNLDMPWGKDSTSSTSSSAKSYLVQEHFKHIDGVEPIVYSVKGRDGKPGEKIFTFPKGKVMGDVYELSDFPGRQRATGTLKFPADAKIGIWISRDGSRDLSWIDGFEPGDLAAVSLQLQEPIDDAAVLKLNRLTGLEELNFEGTRLTNAGLLLISQAFPRLTSLNVSDTKVTADGIAQLKQLRNLDMLRANSVSPVAPFISKLENSSHLRTLELSECDLDDEDLRKISTIRSLTWLHVNESNRITVKGIDYLAKLPELVRLSIEGCPLPPSSIDTFRKLKKLDFLELSVGRSWSEEMRRKLIESLPKTQITFDHVRSNSGEVPNPAVVY